jgi:tetratricopeptide repeat protein
MEQLGSVLGCEKRNTEAEAFLRPALDIQRRVLGPEHQNTLAKWADIGQLNRHFTHSRMVTKITDRTEENAWNKYRRNQKLNTSRIEPGPARCESRII